MKFNGPGKDTQCDYKFLFEYKGWYLVEEKDELAIIIHSSCPGGLNICGGGAVMHWQDHTCQQCHATPPTEVLTAYIFRYWNDTRRMETFRSGGAV